MKLSCIYYVCYLSQYNYSVFSLNVKLISYRELKPLIYSNKGS